MIKKWLKRRKANAFKAEAKKFALFSSQVMMIFLLLAALTTYFTVDLIEISGWPSTAMFGEGVPNSLY